MTTVEGTRESIIWEEVERDAGSHHGEFNIVKILILNTIGHK